MKIKIKEVLIGCEIESQFDISLISLGRKWDATEVSETGKETPEFYTWFKKVKAEEYKRNLLKPIRTAAGLGNQPVRYTNNNNESNNGILKRGVQEAILGEHGCGASKHYPHTVSRT